MPSLLDSCVGLHASFRHIRTLQAGGNTLRSLVVRTTPSGAVEVELPPYKEVCAREMCLFGIEVSPPMSILRNCRWQLVPRAERRAGVHGHGHGRFRATSATHLMYPT